MAAFLGETWPSKGRQLYNPVGVGVQARDRGT